MTPAPPTPPIRRLWTSIATENAPDADRTELHLGLHDFWPADMGDDEWVQVDLNDGSSRLASNEVGFTLLLNQLQRLRSDRGDQFTYTAYRCRPRTEAA